MSEINFTKRLDKYKDRQIKHVPLRTIQIIAEATKVILSKNSKKLSNKDIDAICLKIYKVTNRIKHIRVRNMINSPAIKDQINNKLLQYYIDKGIQPIEKVGDLTEKAEKAAKTTSDYMRVADHYKEIAQISDTTTARQTEIVNYNELMQPVSKTVKREITQSVVSDQDSQSETESQKGNNGENSEKTKE